MSARVFQMDPINGTASENISAYRFVVYASTDQTKKFGQAAATEKPAGIAIDAATSTYEVGVAVMGEGYLEVDGNADAIAAGDYLKPDANGRGVKAATNGDYYGAIALVPSTAAGDIIPVDIVKGRLVVP